MNPGAAKDIMLAVFRDAWVDNGQNIDRVVWDDQPYNIPDGSAPWARVTVKHDSGAVRAFGEGQALHSNSGTLFIQVFTPTGNANLSAYNIAYPVVKAYRAAKTDVWFRNTRLKEVGNSGAFEQTNVLTDFSYDD